MHLDGTSDTCAGCLDRAASRSVNCREEDEATYEPTPESSQSRTREARGAFLELQTASRDGRETGVVDDIE
jgi:hypothetical protein